MTHPNRRLAAAGAAWPVLVAACLWSGSSPAAEPEPLARARSLLAAGQPRQALPLVDLAIARDPASASAYLLRGQIKIELRDWPGSEADLQKGLDLEPNNPDALYLRGYRYAIDGKDKLAIQLYDRAIALAPGRADLWYARGTARERRNDFAGAREDYRQALLRNPDDDEARRELGLVEQRLGLPPTPPGEIARAAAAHAVAGGDRPGPIGPARPVAEPPASAPARPPVDDDSVAIPGRDPATAAAADPPPPTARPPAGEAAAPPGIRAEAATAAAARELLLTFARSILYLGPRAGSPDELRAVCEGLAGNYFAIDLTRDPRSGEVEAGPATAIALGNDRAYALVVAERYAAGKDDWP